MIVKTNVVHTILIYVKKSVLKNDIKHIKVTHTIFISIENTTLFMFRKTVSVKSDATNEPRIRREYLVLRFKNLRVAHSIQ